jgi:peptidoglycan-associated lipoprotein
MSAFKNITPTLALTAAILAAGGLACRKPAPAPPAPEKPAAVAPAPAKTEQSAQKAEDAQKRKAEAAAEAARKAEAAYQQAAAAALQDVHFDFNKSDVREADKPVLAAIAAFMKQYPQANVFIDGNCDERGTVEYNLALGERRAHAVMAYLVGLGTPAARLSMTSYGKERPVCKESTDACWERNRRAHFTLK